MRTVQIDGDAVLAGRAMDPRFDRVLRAVNQFAYVVVNPANGPEAIDGLDLDADAMRDRIPMSKILFCGQTARCDFGTKVLGYLPKSRGEAVAADYRSPRVGTDGVFLAGYTCPEATAAITTINAAWPGAVIVIGTPGCTGGAAAVNMADPAQYVLADGTASNVPSGSLDPYAGYPVAPAPSSGYLRTSRISLRGIVCSAALPTSARSQSTPLTFPLFAPRCKPLALVAQKSMCTYQPAT